MIYLTSPSTPIVQLQYNDSNVQKAASQFLKKSFRTGQAVAGGGNGPKIRNKKKQTQKKKKSKNSCGQKIDVKEEKGHFEQGSSDTAELRASAKLPGGTVQFTSI